MLSNLQVPASFVHPLRRPSKPPVRLPLIITAQHISLKAQSHAKVYVSLIASKNQLASLIIGGLKFKIVTLWCEGKKECDFSVLSATKINVTNLVHFNAIVKRKLAW